MELIWTASWLYAIAALTHDRQNPWLRFVSWTCAFGCFIVLVFAVIGAF